jgi:hypothetical protein
MELSLTMTLTIAVLTMGIFAFATWRAKKPSEPLKVRMVNYHVVQIACLVVLLLMLSHLVTLLTGQNLQGGRSF